MKNKNILLLGGLMHEGEHWQELKDKLQALMPEAHILSLDIPGNGTHNKLQSFLSIRKNVHFLRDQWKKRIDYPSDNYLVSQSMGGMIGMEWSTLFPEDWKKIILINTSHGGISPIYRRFNFNYLFRTIFTHWFESKKRKQEILYFLKVNDIHKKRKTVEKWMKISQLHPVTLKNILKQYWASMNFRKISANPSVPTHIICSRMDRMVNYKCSEDIAQHWKSPIHYHETAGHDPSIEAIDWLLEVIHSSLNKQ